MDLIKDPEYKQWLVDLKARIRQSQLRAMIKVNDEMLRFYWDLGHDIVVRQMDAVWGNGFYKNLSKDLKTEFPDMQGFSVTNLKYCKYFYQFYSQDNQIRQQLVDENRPQVADDLQIARNEEHINRQQPIDDLRINPLFTIPWGHHIDIINKCKSVHEAFPI
jgi:hypothetical protein